MTYSEVLSVEELIRGKLAVKAYDNISKEESESLWEFLLLSCLCDELIENTIQNYKSSLTEIIEVQEQTTAVVTQITNTASVKGEVSLKPSLGGSGSQSKVMNPMYANKVKLFKKSLLESVKTIGCKLYLTIDDLDELSEYTENDEQFINMMKSYLRAVHQLNEFFFENGHHIKIITTIRTDLLEIIKGKSHNTAKLVYDYSIELKWFSPLDAKKEPWKLPLTKMLIQKIKVSTDNINDDEKIYKKYFSSDTKKFGDTGHIEYILRRSFGRPRDAIQFLKKYQKLYPNDNFFNYNHFDNVFSSYASDFYSELMNDTNIYEEREKLQILLRHMAELRFSYFSISDIQKANPDVYENVKDLKILVDLLYSIGAIGISTKKGQRVNVQFSYRDGSPITPSSASTFMLHASISRHLSA